jgi:hypothetical protein
LQWKAFTLTPNPSPEGRGASEELPCPRISAGDLAIRVNRDHPVADSGPEDAEHDHGKLVAAQKMPNPGDRAPPIDEHPT